MRSSILVLALFASLAACDKGEGERCNPLQYSDDGISGNCSQGLACVYPTAPNCGVAYCCALDTKGNVIDKNPNCQPDPDAIAACMLDFSVAPLDAGGAD